MPPSSVSQSRIATMKNVLADGRWTQRGVWSVGAAGPVQQPDCLGVESRGGGLVPPWRTFRPPPFPTPGQAWGTYVVCGCCWASTTARANALMQIVPNLSSLDTLFYSVIYYSVIRIQQYGFEFCYLKWLTLYLVHTVVDFFLYKL